VSPNGDPGRDTLQALPAGLVRPLLDWYRENARDLPWRRTDDPYAALVSEVMLQQTRVETVRERWGEFVERFPDLESLATADEDEVLAEWSGLGYYRRARSLHRLARRVIEDHGGAVPASIRALEELPGVGPYTAAAVGSIAFGRPALALDGNVARVLARLLALDDDPRRAPVARQLRARAAGWLESQPPGQVNQALMELGATVCRPRAPRCTACPWKDECAARRLGIAERIPPSRRQPVEDVVEAGVVVEREGRYLLFRGQRPGVLESMWEFPTLDSRLAAIIPGDDDRGSLLVRYLECLGIRVRLGERLGEIRHGITTRRIRCRLFRGTLREPVDVPLPRLQGANAGAAPASNEPSEGQEGTDLPRPEAAWFEASETPAIPLAASARRVFEEVLEIEV